MVKVIEQILSEQEYLQHCISEKENELYRKGYHVEPGRKCYDLLATRNGKVLLIKFKYTNKNQKRRVDMQLRHFMSYAKKIGAEPHVIYLSKAAATEF